MHPLKTLLLLLALLYPTLLFAQDKAEPLQLEDIRILKISPQDQRAIVKTAKGNLGMIKPGDPVGANGKIVEVAEGRVVLEEVTDQGLEKVIIRFDGKKQSIERYRSEAERKPLLFAPSQKESEEVDGGFTGGSFTGKRR